MDSFRWVLLLIGLVIFLLIFLVSRRRDSVRDRQPEKISPVFSNAGAQMPADKTNDLSAPDPAVSMPVEGKQELAADPVVTQTPAGNKPGTATVAHDDDTGKVIALYLVEKHGGMLTGADIISSLEQVGLRYGDMKIFHYYSDLDSSQSPPLFSMANLVDPGWFDLISIDKIRTPGLSLFMQLPGPVSSVRAFDEMVEVIDSLQQLLPVTLKDKSRNKVSRQMLMHMREEIVEFERARAMQVRP